MQRTVHGLFLLCVYFTEIKETFFFFFFFKLKLL